MTQEIYHPLVKFSGHIGITVSKDGEEISMAYEGQVPKELEDNYQKIIGNALAKVTVSADAANKNFGRGASAMVSVTLSCNQDQQTIAYAIQLAGATARHFSKVELDLGESELKKLLEAKGLIPVGQ